MAPLALNEPDFCKNSHLKYKFVEKNSSSFEEALTNGVLLI